MTARLDRAFAEKFDAEHLLVFETACWSVLVRKGQVTLGSLVLAANRQFLSASDLSLEEAADFPRAVGRLERALRKAFQYDKINYLCLMMVDAHYHFHVIPRYETQREFSGRSWTDTAWPAPPVLAMPPTDDAIVRAVADYLKQVDEAE